MVGNQTHSRRNVLKGVGSIAGLGVGLPTLHSTTDTVAASSATGRQNYSDWPMYQYDNARTGHNPDLRTPIVKPREIWRGRTRGTQDVTVVDNRVYQGHQNHRVVAYDGTSGEWLWSSPTEAKIYVSPTVSEGVVYIGDASGTLYAFDAVSGVEQWRYQFDARPLTPLVADGTLYVMDTDSTLHAINIETQTELWRYEGEYYYANPILAHGTLYFSTERTLKAADPTTGELKWEQEARGRPRYLSADEERIYVPRSSNLHAVDPTDGTTVWMRRDEHPRSSPAIAYDRVYFGNGSNQVVAVDRETGEEVWRYQAEKTSPGGIAADPVVAQNQVYFGTYAGNAYALNAHSGRRKWTYNAGKSAAFPSYDEEFVGSPAVVGSRLYIGTRYGGPIALENAPE